METLDPSLVTRPFAKINLWRNPNGSVKVRCYVLVERPFENAKTGVAIDGSASMRPAFGYSPGLLGALFSSQAKGTNRVGPEARRICGYLARQIDVDGQTSIIYWGTGPYSESIEVIGDLTADEIAAKDFSGPRSFGGGKTALLAAVRYFTERFVEAPWGMYVFLSDGLIRDLVEVKSYSVRLAHEIVAGCRPPLKLILIGVGDQIDERQMIELDDLDTGTALDLWDHKVVHEMRELTELFAEVVDETAILADSGTVRDGLQNVVRQYRDGLPALLEFELPAGAADAFTLELGGQAIRQPLR